MLWYLLASHVSLAVIATVLIFWLDYSDRPQAIVQTVVACCIPLVGPVLILVFLSVVHRNMTTRPDPDKPNPNREVRGAITLEQFLRGPD